MSLFILLLEEALSYPPGSKKRVLSLSIICDSTPPFVALIPALHMRHVAAVGKGYWYRGCPTHMTP